MDHGDYVLVITAFKMSYHTSKLEIYGNKCFDISELDATFD